MKIILVLMLFILTGCSEGNYNNMLSNNSEQIKVAIYPTGTLSESYYFVMNIDGELIVEKGTRTGNDIIQNSFIKNREELEKKNLSSSEVSKILNLANGISETDFNVANEIVYDCWEIQIVYQEKVIKQNYWSDTSPEVKNLVDEFIKISPIEVILHEWS